MKEQIIGKLENYEPRFKVPEDARITKRGDATIIEISSQEKKGKENQFICPLIINSGQCKQIRILLKEKKEVTLKEAFENINVEYNENSIGKLKLYLPREINNFAITGNFPECKIRLVE